MFASTRFSGSALAAAVLILGADAALAQKRPDAAYNTKDVALEVSAGSVLRRGERLLDPLVATIWTKMTFKGAGPCSADACPLNFNGETVYARRSRVTLVGVADTEGARLWAFEVQGPGKLKPKAEFAAHSGRIIAGLPGPARFDSLAVMASGNITVATLNTGMITEISPSGDIVRSVQVPDIYPTNICFGGADMRTAFVTLSDSGRLGVMRWPEPGLKLNFN